MSFVIISNNALKDIQRLKDFLKHKNPIVASNAAKAIKKTINLLKTNPRVGRPVRSVHGEVRDIFVPFGIGGYVIRYIVEGNTVEIVAIKHGREADFQF